MNSIKEIFSEKQRPLIYLLGFLVFIYILTAYSNSLYAPFTLDDSHSFVKEPRVLGFSLSFAAIAELAKTKFGLWRFLPMLTFASDLQWGGGNILAFHITNIIIHILATVAIFFLLHNLFSLFHGYKCSSSRVVPFSPALLVIVIAGLWALNPVQTNAVTYLVQRMTSMAAMFYFFSFGCYLRGRIYHLSTGWHAKVFGWYFLCFILGVCALLSKQIAITLPIMVLLTEFLFVEQSGLIRFVRKHKVAVVIIVAIGLSSAFYVISPKLVSLANSRRFTVTERLLTELRVLGSYIFLLFLPLPRFLNLEHDVVLSTSLFSPLSTLVSLLFLGAIIFGAWKFRKRYPLVSFGLFWFFINLLLESTFIPLELKFEHRLYLPSLGFYLSLVVIFSDLYARFWPQNNQQDGRIVFVVISVLLFSSLSLLTYSRNATWEDSVTLYRDCLAKSPLKPRVHGNLAKALADSGEYEQALVECEKALDLGVKGYEEYWVSATNIIANTSHIDGNQVAIQKADVLLKQAPLWAKKNAYPLFLLNLGRLYFLEHDYQSSFDTFLKGLQCCVHHDLSLYTKKFEKFVEVSLESGLKEGFLFNSELEINEKSTTIIDEKMAEIFFALGEYDVALKYCDLGVSKNKSSPGCGKIKDEIYKVRLLNNTQRMKGTIKTKYFYHPFASRFNFFMASVYTLVKNGLAGNFVTEYLFESAKKLRPNHPDVLLLHSWLLYKSDCLSEAIAEIEKALALDPEYAQLWINRGIYCLAAHENAAALNAFSRAMKLYPDYPHERSLEAMIIDAEKGIAEKVSINDCYFFKGVHDG